MTKSRRCAECGFRGDIPSTFGDYEFQALPGTILRGVEHRTCPQCGDVAVVIPKLAELVSLLTSVLVKKPAPLTPDEFKFLRKSLGWSGQETAKRLGVQAETVSRWEHGKRTLGATPDRLIRMCVVAFEPIEDYAEHDLEFGAESSPLPRFEFSKRKWVAIAA